MKDLQIQIVNYKTKQYLIKSLASVIRDLEGSNISYSVKLLENASGEDLSDVPALFPGCDIDVHISDRNLGFGGGQNLLAKKGSSRYILFLNPDIEIRESRTISRLIDSCEKSHAKIIGPELIEDNGDPQPWDHGELTGLFALITRNIGRSYWKHRFEKTKAYWVSGAHMIIERGLFEMLGGYDENFFMYKEDEDLCIRAHMRGETAIYDPTIKVFHHGTVTKTKTKNMPISRRYYLKKHGNSFFLYKLLSFF